MLDKSLVDLVTPLVAVALILAVLAPIWLLWIGTRALRHLDRIANALYRLDAHLQDPSWRSEAQRAHGAAIGRPEPVSGRVVNSMFGR